MSADEVLVTRRALNDLCVLPPAVQEAVLTALETELRPWPRPGDPDEGCVPEHWSLYTGIAPDQGLRWRRGTTPHIRQFLQMGVGLDPALEDACDYLIIYRVEPVPSVIDAGGPYVLRALRIFPHAAVAAAVIRYLTQEFQPQNPG
jgi:hypothetical protein